jgi:hypothetical protein
MTMVHHSGKDYDVAVGEAAANFQRKLEEMIHESVPRVERVIEQVQNDVPDDTLVKGASIRFEPGDGHLSLIAVAEETEKRNEIAKRVHNHAFGQIASRAGIANFRPYANELNNGETWKRELLAENLNRVYGHSAGRYLTRVVRGELRGFLSDSYKRMNTAPLLDTFMGLMKAYGARPVDGFALQTKERVRAILPYIFEPFPGEYLAFGAQFGNSNYGDGAFEYSQIVMRAWCTNFAISEDILHKIHLGARLPDNLAFSQRTIDLNTQAVQSALKDVAHLALGAPAVNDYMAMVRKANEEKVEAAQINTWVKKNLHKGEAERVKEVFSSADVEKLPPGQTAWRFSNAVSWLANEVEDEHRKLELQELAGTLLPKAA